MFRGWAYSKTMTTYRIKRIYDAPEKTDGYRVLVDRLWPRGVSKERAALDAWRKDLAPSPKLRVWFGHEAGKFTEFSRRYRQELEANPAVSAFTLEMKAYGVVTLLYAARDSKINHAAVLCDFLSN